MASETTKPAVIPFDAGRPPVVVNLDALKNAALWLMLGLIVGYTVAKLRKI